MNRASEMLGLGIDPGVKHHGFAVLDITLVQRPVWIEGGKTDDLMVLLRTWLRKVEFVAVERPRAQHKPEANVPLLATSWNGGGVSLVAQWEHIEVIELTHQHWRDAFVGRARKGEMDHAIEATLRAHVRGMPKRTNVHARDSAGLCCVAARMARARRTASDAAVLRSVPTGRLVGAERVG